MSRIASLILMLALSHPVLAEELGSSAAQEQFNELKQLVGTWLPEDSKSDNFQIEFGLTAGESVLVESWVFKGNLHSMTVYHLDNDSVMATHYCPQGNQPRLVSVPDENSGEVRFIFKDATNLDRDKQSYQIALAFLFDEDSNTVLRKETYQKTSGQEPSEMRLVRKPASSVNS